jgi:hypothetical protein
MILDLSEILHHSQSPVGAGSPFALKPANTLNKPARPREKTQIYRHEQARCLFHKDEVFLWGGILPAPKTIVVVLGLVRWEDSEFVALDSGDLHRCDLLTTKYQYLLWRS